MRPAVSFTSRSLIAVRQSPTRMPALSPGPLGSTRSARRPPPQPADSTHHTPSEGIWKSRSFWKLIQARTTAAVVSKMSRPAVKRIWNSRFMDRNGSCDRVGESPRSEEHTSELQSPCNLVCRLLLEKKKEKRVTQKMYQKKTRKRQNHN